MSAEGGKVAQETLSERSPLVRSSSRASGEAGPPIPYEESGAKALREDSFPNASANSRLRRKVARVAGRSGDAGSRLSPRSARPPQRGDRRTKLQHRLAG